LTAQLLAARPVEVYGRLMKPILIAALLCFSSGMALAQTAAPSAKSTDRPPSPLQQAIDKMQGQTGQASESQRKTVNAVLDADRMTFYTDDGRAIPFNLWVRLQQLPAEERREALRQLFPQHEDTIIVFGRDPTREPSGDQFGARFKGMTFAEVGKELGFDPEALRPGLSRVKGGLAPADANRFGGGTGGDVTKPDFSGGTRWRDRILSGQRN
jgi:hypothetical protein